MKHLITGIGIWGIMGLLFADAAHAMTLKDFDAALADDGFQNFSAETQAGIAQALLKLKTSHDNARAQAIQARASENTDQLRVSPSLLGVLFGAVQLTGFALPQVATDFKNNLIEADLALNYGADSYTALVSLSREVDYAFPPVSHPKPTDPVEAIFPTTMSYQADWSDSVLNASASNRSEAVKIHTRFNIGNIYVKGLSLDFSQAGVVSGAASIEALGGLYGTTVKFSVKLPQVPALAQNP